MKKSNVLTILTVLFLVFMLSQLAVFQFVPSVKASSSLYEYYNTGDDIGYGMYGTQWGAQTFTVSATAHTVTSVKLKMYRSGSPGTLTVSIRATDADGYPTGVDLTNGTINGNTFTTSTSGAWNTTTLTEYTLVANTKYAIVCRATTGGSSNYVGWRLDSTSSTYAGGSNERSYDSGSTWTIDIYDLMFEVWGNPVGGAPEYQYVTQTSNVDGVADKGTHSNFENQKATDSTYDTLTEANVPVISNNLEDYVDSIYSTVYGTHSDFTKQQATDLQYDTLTEADTGGAPLTITFRAAGVKASGSGAVTPALPAGVAIGDICILVATTIAGGSASITTNGGSAWTALTGSPIDVTSGEKLYVWYRRHASGDSAPTVTPGGDHCCAGIAAWYNCISSGSPIDVSETGTETTSDTTFSFATTISTTVNGAMCIAICSTGADTTFAQFTVMADSSLSSLAERMDYCTSSGGGGGFALDNGYKATAGAVGTWAATLSTASTKAYISFALKPALAANYQLDLEEQWTSATYNRANEYLCIKTGTVGAEALKVDVYYNSAWTTVINPLTASQWNNVSVSAYLTSATLIFRFKGTSEASDTSQDTWQIDSAVLTTYDTTNNYRLEIEEEFTSCNYTRTNRELCIKTGTFNAGGETISVQWWNTTSSSWLTIIASLTASQWNNISVTTYLTSGTFTIRFIDGTQSSDSSQGTWQKDCALLHTWNILVSYRLNLRVMDWDLTDAISGALVYKDSDVKTSDANGWANWTLVSGTVQIKVQYYGFWVNGTFSLSMDSDKTINVQCKLYDVTVLVQESVQNAYLVSANVTVYNSTSVQGNKITSGVTGNNGQVQLLNLPNNTLTFTQYGGASYSLVIGNTTRLVSSENQTITLTADQNNINTNNSYSIIAFAGMTIPLKGSFATGRLKKKKRNK